MKFTAAELATDAGRQRLADHLAALRNGDRILTVTITWWRDDVEIEHHGPVPAHLLLPEPPPIGGATHLTVEEREVPL